MSGFKSSSDPDFVTRRTNSYGDAAKYKHDNEKRAGVDHRITHSGKAYQGTSKSTRYDFRAILSGIIVGRGLGHVVIFVLVGRGHFSSLTILV